ncbi:MAG: YceI family protein [Bacteroidota bacterium]
MLRLLSVLALILASGALATGLHAQPVSVRTAGSQITYAGTSALHDWTGTSRRVTGTVDLDRSAPARSSFTIQAPVSSFDSGNGTRDRKMREATEASRFPTVRFASRSIQVRSWSGSAGARSGRWRVTGDLTFHGRTRRVSVNVEARESRGRFIATGTFPISLAAYGVERPGIGPVKIGDQITLSFEIVAPLQ